MDKLEKLSLDVKTAADALVQVQRSIADVRHEYLTMQKGVTATDQLKRENADLNDKLTKIALFVGKV